MVKIKSDEIKLQHFHFVKHKVNFFTFATQQARHMRCTAGCMQTMLLLHTLVHVLHKTIHNRKQDGHNEKDVI